VYAGIFRFEGQVAIFKNGEGACYRCLYPQIPDSSEIPTCSETGVLGALPGIIGSIQALETLKLILNFESVRMGQLFIFDALNLETRTLRIPRRLDCPHCGVTAVAFDDSNSNSLSPFETAQELKQISSEAARLHVKSVWLDVRSEQEFAWAHWPGARNIPLTKLADELATLDRNKTYLVYCASGQRSLAAQSLLLRQGFNDVWNLRGGLVL
jgi:rhodanese-related sulfurtransferase